MILEASGYLLLALHTHMPYVRQPDLAYPWQENWVFEAITECYIPLLRVFSQLVTEGIAFKVTVSLTPCLVSMLLDEDLQQRYLGYLDDHILLAEAEIRRLHKAPNIRRLAERRMRELGEIRTYYRHECHQDLVQQFKSLAETGCIELITSAATHAYLPLWMEYPKLVDFQIRVGCRQHRQVFGEQPAGFWLPECAFYPGLDKVLHQHGLQYSFVETHALRLGSARPVFDVYAPVITPNKVTLFGRDQVTHDLVWRKEIGYMGDGHYIDIQRDIGFDLPPHFFSAFTHQETPAATGMQYYRMGRIDNSDIYDPDAALRRCAEHAEDFVRQCTQMTHREMPGSDRKPLIVSPFDTEHFGHWWREGPIWLDLVLRKLAAENCRLKMVSAPDYLQQYPQNQLLMPSMSSWGYQGYSETWLMGRNHWIYPMLYDAIDQFEELLQECPHALHQHRPELNQYLRELLLAQSSDWAFILHQESDMEFAIRQVRQPYEHMQQLSHQIRTGQINHDGLKNLAHNNNLFHDLDLVDLYLASGLSGLNDE